MTTEVSETGDEEETRLRLVGEEVSRGESKVVRRVGFGVEEDGLGGHVYTREKSQHVRDDESMDEKGKPTSVDDSELLRVGSPGEVVNGSLLVESDSALEATSKGDQVEVGLSVVGLVGLIDVRGGEEKSLQGEKERKRRGEV